MINPIPQLSEPTSKVDAAAPARRLRPTQAAPAQRDPRAEGCIDEYLGGTMPAALGWRTVRVCDCTGCGTSGGGICAEG
jgi:hypothetical protein